MEFEQVKWRVVSAGFWDEFSKLASASREWQVSKLAGELACEGFMPPLVGNAGGRLLPTHPEQSPS